MRNMKAPTSATLERLRAARFFERVGACEVGAVRVVSSWEDAVLSAVSVEWQYLQLEAANILRERLAATSQEKFREWNGIVKMLRPVAIELAASKVATVELSDKLRKPVLDCVSWDILHVLMEAEYSDIQGSGYYASNAYWYVTGHFPCGWDGVCPNGNIVVY